MNDKQKQGNSTSAGLKYLGAREVRTNDCEHAENTFACLLHVLKACRCRLFPFVDLGGIGLNSNRAL
ncbi:unnamed protein product [Ixodes pacificus]